MTTWLARQYRRHYLDVRDMYRRNAECYAKHGEANPHATLARFWLYWELSRLQNIIWRCQDEMANPPPPFMLDFGRHWYGRWITPKQFERKRLKIKVRYERAMHRLDSRKCARKET